MKRALVLALCLPNLLWADDWRMLSGEEITEALTNKHLVFTSAEQWFYASGRTLYNAGQDSWGYWAVRDDRYCSQWPPSDRWDCYDVSVHGMVVRFIADDGSTSDGVYAR